jgi:predicted RNA-binding protein with PIN domain
MRGFSATWSAVLNRAIKTARQVLRDLDEAEIPAALSKVASYQGGRLPPPLAARLLKELDENEWFRDKVADAWEGETGDASDLFLTRPAGWWVELTTAFDAADGEAEGRRLADMESRIGRVEAKRAAATKKAKELKKVAEDAKRSAKQMVESAKNAAEERFSGERAESAAARTELQKERERLAKLETEHQELQEAFALLRARFAKARRGRFDDAGHGRGSSSLPTDPVKLARVLDLQTAEMGRDSSQPAATKPPAEKALGLAPGVRPDSSDAIRWLIGLGQPVVVLVDGYNAQFHIDRGDFTSGAARRYLIAALKRLRSTGSVRHRFVVVYDSTLPGDRAARTSLGGVEVRFAEEERIADEEIVEMASELSRAVVISSDRAVREGAEANGAVVLWSEALAQWLSRT